jgi:uncharacterized protein (DUF427 family)
MPRKTDAAAAVPIVRRLPDPSGQVYWEPSERWVRGVKDGLTVVDSRRPVLVWEPGRPVPLYAFPVEDIRMDLLGRAETTKPPEARPHPGAAEFFDLTVRPGGETVAGAAWTYIGDDLADHLSFEWFGRDVLDHWYEEAEEIFVHPRDPHTRVDALPSSRHVRVEIEGTVVAESRAPVLLFETGLPVRYYLPREDVRLDLLTPLPQETRCRTRDWPPSTGPGPVRAMYRPVSRGATSIRCRP